MAAFSTKKIAPCLWFDNRIEEAVNFYVLLFGGKVHDTSYYPDGAPMPKGTVLTMTFTLQDEEFMALNGGPHFKFNEAVSFVVDCADQTEVDYYWEKLGAGGNPAAQQCGWLKDKYGLSWQIVPKQLADWVTDPDRAKADRTMAAVFKMKKLDVAELRRAHDGE